MNKNVEQRVSKPCSSDKKKLVNYTKKVIVTCAYRKTCEHDISGLHKRPDLAKKNMGILLGVKVLSLILQLRKAVDVNKVNMIFSNKVQPVFKSGESFMVCLAKLE